MKEIVINIITCRGSRVHKGYVWDDEPHGHVHSFCGLFGTLTDGSMEQTRNEANCKKCLEVKQE